MNTAFRIVKALAIYAYPYLPESMSRLQGYLGYSSVPAWDEALRDFSDVQYSMELERPKALYRVLEDPLKESGKGQGEKGSGKDGGHPEGGGKKKKKKKKHKVKPEPRPISLANVDLRVGRVLEIGDHPDADKLYVMKVDVGEAEPRTIIAGLKAHYPSVSLIGKNLVIVCNLKPVKLRGILSQGMMMAADKDDVVSFLTPITDADPGERVTGHLVEEVDPIHEMTIDEFFTIPMVVRKIVRVQDDGFLMDTEMVIRDSQQLQGDPVGIEIVVAQDNILGTSKGPISPERVIGPGASIR